VDGLSMDDGVKGVAVVWVVKMVTVSLLIGI
jgi:hypothetical protein